MVIILPLITFPYQEKRVTPPLLLQADNFTPPQRTPWGGTRIASVFKPFLGIAAGTIVGESWEISVEPDFPSRLADSDSLLSKSIAAAPEDWLGRDASVGSVALLVKLLDAASPLSVQIHPADNDPGLAPDESGKPESWYILDREPGAGLYLGLREGVTEASMRSAIQEGQDVSQLLYFVPVEPGDCFFIAAGTAHAIGPGITLVEPQRVIPGRRGLTYRYWDWNRRYDEEGRPNSTGKERPLHLEEALRVTRWDAPREERLLEKIRHRAGRPAQEPRLEPLIGPSAPTSSNLLQVTRISGTGSLVLPTAEHFRGLTVARGSVQADTGWRVGSGQSAAIPACLPATELLLDQAEAIVCSAPLSDAGPLTSDPHKST